MTQVTSRLADDPTWDRVLRGMLVLSALWWAWVGYAWLTSATDVDEGGVRLAMLASVGAMLIVALAVPGAFGDDAVLFGVARRPTPSSRPLGHRQSRRSGPPRRAAGSRRLRILGPSLLVVAGFLEGDLRIVVWVVALAIDYLGNRDRRWARLEGRARALRRAARADHPDRARRVIAIGVGAGFELDTGVIVAATLGIVVVSALWWLYFDVAAIVARRRLMEATGLELHRLACTPTATSICR